MRLSTDLSDCVDPEVDETTEAWLQRRRVNETVRWKEVLEGLCIPFRERPNGALVILCPFHEEKTPSGWCYPKGNFHCYGCKVHADRIRFVRLLKPQFRDRPIDDLFFAPLSALRDSEALKAQLPLPFVPA